MSWAERFELMTREYERMAAENLNGELAEYYEDGFDGLVVRALPEGRCCTYVELGHGVLVSLSTRFCNSPKAYVRSIRAEFCMLWKDKIVYPEELGFGDSCLPVFHHTDNITRELERLKKVVDELHSEGRLEAVLQK